MPDRRKHRGKHPDDPRRFDEASLPRLRDAAAQLAWLLTHGYAIDSALKLVGDRHDLTSRQRLAVRRATCGDDALAQRLARNAAPQEAAKQPLGIDGYNVLITIEAALSGGMILIGRDGCYRDLAGVHGTYRHVEETGPALGLLIGAVDALSPQRVDLFLDKPVSNSGRLKTTLAELLESRRGTTCTWNIQLVNSPDRILVGFDGIVASSDSVILDGCNRWIDLPQRIIDAHVVGAWNVDLRART